MRRDIVTEVEEGTSCYIEVKKPDERFKCSCCQKPIAADPPHMLGGIQYLKTEKMFVDTHQNAYCGNCYSKCLDWTVRSVKKNPDETRPRMIHQSGNYYQLLRREKAIK